MPAVLISLLAGLGSLVSASQATLAASEGGASIAAGTETACAIESGKAYCWGFSEFGELGDGSTANSSVPVAVDASGVLAGKTLIQISTNGFDTCALDSTGAAYCWGLGGLYGLGDGSTANSSVPVAVDTSGVLAGKTLTQISVGLDATCALDSGGAAYCWGVNLDGQLGDGSAGASSNSDVPVAVDTSGVLAGKTLTRISAGSYYACALDSTGAAYCWGISSDGALGDGSFASSGVPVAVDTSGVLAGKTLTQISAGVGGFHTCAMDASGAVYCWGQNDGGQLGNGITTNSSVPVAVHTSGVLAGKTLTQITASSEDTCALDSAGVAFCWGDNGYGDLGDGNTTGSSVPVAVDTSGVLAGKNLTQISAGSSWTCAVDTADSFYCWGYNGYGGLGDDGAVTQSDVPVLTGPQAPTITTVIPADMSASVSWTAPGNLDGGSLTGYTATASPTGETCTTTGAITCTITGLTNGTTYSVNVVAHTTVGDSGNSAAAAVTPGSRVAFTSDRACTAMYGVPFSFAVTASGSPAPKITKSGRLPSGVRFIDHSNGTATISGIPANAAGVYPLTLTAQNEYGTATQAFTLTVTRAPVVKNIPATRATVGIALNLAITAAGYPLPALTESGALPAGLTFTDNGNGTASLAGSPTAGSGGSYPIKVTAANSSGDASGAFILKVDEAPVITSAGSTTAVVGSTFSYHVAATGFPTPKITVSGRLPKGVHFNSATATFSGIPMAGTSGSYPITITARNNSGAVIQSFTLTVT
jgi:alpha-tubulin suppressor-like RCC1 family protein